MIIGSSSGWLMFAGMMARPTRDLLPHELGGHPFPQRDELHLRGDFAPAGIVHLGDRAPAPPVRSAEGWPGSNPRE